MKNGLALGLLYASLKDEGMNYQKYFKVFSQLLGTTLCHPQFFSKYFLNQQIKRKSKFITGLIVDMGCGNGPYKKYFSHAHYIGLDYPETIIDDTISNDSLNIFGDMISLPFKNSCLDCAICTQVLEHIKEPWGVLSEIGRIIKPGGKLLISVPFFYPLHDEPNDFLRFSPHGLKYLLERSDFKVIEITPQGGFITMFAELFNLFCLHKVQKLLAKKGVCSIFGGCLIPIVLLTSVLMNIMSFSLSFLDRERRFVMNYFVIAERRANGL